MDRAQAKDTCSLLFTDMLSAAAAGAAAAGAEGAPSAWLLALSPATPHTLMCRLPRTLTLRRRENLTNKEKEHVAEQTNGKRIFWQKNQEA